MAKQALNDTVLPRRTVVSPLVSVNRSGSCGPIVAVVVSVKVADAVLVGVIAGAVDVGIPTVADGVAVDSGEPVGLDVGVGRGAVGVGVVVGVIRAT